MNNHSFIDLLSEQGYYFCDNFLKDSEACLLRKNALALATEGRFQNAKIGNQQKAQLNQVIRSDKIHWLDQDSPHIDSFWQAITHIQTQLNQTLYLGLQAIETHFALYQAGSFYKKHTDQFKNKTNRKLSFVYYLNPNWEADFGGQLILYNTHDEVIQTILPQWNRFVCFLSDLPHEVQPTTKTRLSITGWMKTQETPLNYFYSR